MLQSSMSFLRKPWLYVVLIFLVSVALRSYQSFSSVLQPGINGGYYPVQVRSVIETGRLAYPDMPLVFYNEALVSLIVHTITNYSLSSTILFTTKLFDGIVPPLLIFIVFIFAKHNLKTKNSQWVAVTISALGGLSVFLLQGLSGDFTKNSTAILLTGLFAIYLYSKRKNLFTLILLFIICGITHKTGLALVTIFTIIYFLSKNRYIQNLDRKRLVLLAIIFFILQSVITSLISSSFLTLLVSGFGVISGQSYLGFLFTWLILLIITFSLKNYSSKISSEHFIRLVLLMLLTSCLISPFLGASYVLRLWFISSLPLIFVLVFAFPYLSYLSQKILIILIILFVSASIILFIRDRKIPLLKYPAYQEIVVNLKTDNNSIVISDHGVNWWIAWGTHNKVAQDRVLSRKETESYKNIYYVNYRPQKELYSWFGNVSISSNANLIYKGDYIDIYKCQSQCF